MTIVRLFDAFIHFEQGQAPLLYYANLSMTTEVVKTAFVVSTLIISDILLVSAASVHYDHN